MGAQNGSAGLFAGVRRVKNRSPDRTALGVARRSRGRSRATKSDARQSRRMPREPRWLRGGHLSSAEAGQGQYGSPESVRPEVGRKGEVEERRGRKGKATEGS